MAKLSPSDVKLFHKLMDALLFYANKKLNIIKNCSTKEDFFKNDIEKTISIRQKIFSESLIIELFIKENPEKFNEEELNIISSWKLSKEGEFFFNQARKRTSFILPFQRAENIWSFGNYRFFLRDV